MADVHLGAKPDSDYPWGKERAREIEESFEDIIHICAKEQIELLLIAGDLYHRQPLLRELREINQLFERIPQTKVVIIAGNHDYIGPRSHYLDFPWAKNVVMLKSEQLEKVYFPELNTEVYGFSHHRRNIPEARLTCVHPEANDCCHILIAHGGDEKNIPMDCDQVAKLPFDYIALGHIHKPTIISSKCAFCGSFEPLDKNEIGDRGYILGEIKDKKVTTTFVPHSIRTYQWLEIYITPDMTQEEVCTFVQAEIRKCGEKNIYRVHLVGYRDVNINFDEEAIKFLANIIEVLDDTVPDYDFEQLKVENQENIIGLYIDKIHESSTEEEIRQKALYYGLEALLNAKGRS